MHSRPVVDQYMTEAHRLRARNASRAEVEGAARVLYPSDSARDKNMRSRLWRACSVPAVSFAEAFEAYRRGANSSEVLAYLGRNSNAGAPEGNLNGTGKKRKSSERRFAGMWRAMPRDEQDRFLAAHQLRRA